MKAFLLQVRYWLARLRSGYGPIRLQTLPEGTITVSVYSRGRWVPVIAEFGELAGGCTIDHSVSEIEILSHVKRPFYAIDDEGLSRRFLRRARRTRRAGR